MLTDPILRRTLIATALIHLAFATLPGIDLWTSALFFDGARFSLQDIGWAQNLRYLLWHLSMSVVFALLVATFAAVLVQRTSAQDQVARGALQLGFLIVGPGLVVNEGLKAHWGRARPQDVLEFGGAAQFTPPFQIADECLRNCSFVSGEVAMAVGAALVAHHVLAPAMTPRAARAFGLGLICLCLISATLRVAMGRHFLSDALFATLLMVILHRVTLMLTPAPLRTNPPFLSNGLADCRAALPLIASGARRLMAVVATGLSRRPAQLVRMPVQQQGATPAIAPDHTNPV